jgi:hypothetical protein
VSQGRPPSTREREAAPCGLTSSTLHCESELRFVSQLAKGIDPNASRMCAELVQLRLSIIAVRKLIYPTLLKLPLKRAPPLFFASRCDCNRTRGG